MQLQKLTLADVTDEFVNRFFYATWDEKIYDFLTGYWSDSTSLAKKNIDRILSTPNSNAYVISDTGKPFIGMFQTVEKGMVNGKNEVEFSVFVKEEYRKKGYASEALQHFLNKYSGYRIIFCVDEFNTASLRQIRKFGAKLLKKAEYLYYYIEL